MSTAPARPIHPPVVALLLGLLLHALLLAAWRVERPAASAAAPAALQLRHIVLAAAPPAARPMAAPAPQPALRSASAKPAAPRSVASAQAGAAPVAPPPAAADPAADPATDPATAADSAGPAAAAAEGAPLPVYATRLPPPARLQFELRRGGASGQAELTWEPAESGQYRLGLDARLDGGRLIGWLSQGRLDEHGIAPSRHADRQRGRELRAANFQREPQAGPPRVSFSGPGHEVPLLPGTQDRLSWMLQLPAILEANPALREPGERISVQVVGARGEAAAWHFFVQGREDLALGGLNVPGALHLARAPQGPYDTEVQVWLDPQQHHLPVQLRLGTPALGETLALRLATPAVVGSLPP